jgi:beta-carotene 3-hydroxylase
MAVARLVAAPFPLAASRARGPPARLVFAPLSLSARGLPSTRGSLPVLRVASDGRADAAEADEAATPARMAVSERKARKESERRTYLVAAVMSSLGITSMAAAAVYYRFAWQMEVLRLPFCLLHTLASQFPFQISVPLNFVDPFLLLLIR